ncbi:MAG: hypothetical protein EP349_01095 [Alphaproteobacteria bacterium]|nr:MAG: hypothetical protein EP349_01095 [Alphaproteobacteria bacterium]
MESYTDKINNVTVSVALGDLTQLKVDAFVVPEFAGGASYGGVGGAVANGGGDRGLEAYQQHVNKNGKQAFGAVVLTESGGGNAPYLLHAASVGSEREEEFLTVQTSIVNALETAHEKGLSSVAAPALGTGIIGQLTDTQSAKAMMSAVDAFSQKYPDAEMEVSLVIFGSGAAYNSFLEVLQNKSYENVSAEAGGRVFDFARWNSGMEFHTETEQKFAEKRERTQRQTNFRNYTRRK